jgi:hypothetical protein
MRTRLVVVTALLLSSALSPAMAATANAPRSTGRPGEIPGQSLAQLSRIVTASSGVMLTGQPPTRGEGYDQDSAVMPAGDLNGDGRSSVLDLRSFTTSGPAYEEGITARDGRTGHMIWQTSTSSNCGYVSVFVTPLGAKNKPGVLLVSTDCVPEADNTQTITLNLVALSGVNGHQLWSKSLSGQDVNFGESLQAEPVFEGIIRDGSKGPSRVLVGERTGSSGPLYTTRLRIVRGIDGSAHNFAIASAPEGYPSGLVTPDVTGDGRQDVAFSRPGESNSPGSVTLLNGATAKKVWRSTKFYPGDGFDSVTNVGTAKSPYLAFVEDGEFDNTIDLVRANDGKLVWTKSETAVFTIGTSGKAKTPIIEQVAVVYSPANKTTGFGYAVRVTAVAGLVTGKTIWRFTKYIAITNTADDGAEYDGALVPVGDVQPDGYQDMLLHMYVATNNQVKSVNDFVNGKTAKRHSLAFSFGTDGSLISGKATDLADLTVTSPGGDLVLSAWRGSTRELYYENTLPGLTGVTEDAIDAMRVSDNPCSDFGLSADTSTGEVQEVLDGRGAALWSVSFTAGELTGGTLTTSPKPKHFCA